MSIITTNLKWVIDDLNQGKPVAIPTETVYGLAALITNEAGIRAIYALKNRPLNHPLIVHVAKDFDLQKLVHCIPDYAKKLIEHFWPGPLTLVFQAKDKEAFSLITGGQSTIAIRCPAHPLTQQLLQKLETPLVAPSANAFGKISPTTAAHVQQSFPGECITILNGGRCSVGIESTIIDATEKEGYQILRPGLINEQDLAEIAPQLQKKESNPIRVPGKLDTHYQPEKPLYYYENGKELENSYLKNKQKIFIISPTRPAFINEGYFICFPSAFDKAAYELYYQLRKADESDAKYIAIEIPPPLEAWTGVRERILKAGQPLADFK